MTNKAFNFVQPIIDIPSDLSTFKQRPQVRWTGNDWQHKLSVSVGYGTASGTWSSSKEYTIRHQKDLYSLSQNDGFRAFNSAFKESESIYMMDTNSRWMPASVFNGVGFETYHFIESGNNNHQVYLNAFGVVFEHRTANIQIIYGWNTGNTDGPGHDQYGFHRITGSDSSINTIRNWGSDYLFKGLVISLKTKAMGVGSTDSYIDLYNLKVGSRYSNNASNYKVHPLALRPYSARDMHTGGTNKFAYFKPNLF